jgi:hypothetical protein
MAAGIRPHGAQVRKICFPMRAEIGEMVLVVAEYPGGVAEVGSGVENMLMPELVYLGIG